MSTDRKLPIVDCSEIIFGSLHDVENTAAFKTFTQSIGDGMRNFGFVYMINHGTTPEKVENLFSKCLKFFQLPAEVKAKYKKIDEVISSQGYTSSGDETVGELNRKRNGAPGLALPDLKECYDVFADEAKEESIFPAEVSGFKHAVDEFRSSLIHLVEKILRAFANYLNLQDQDYFIKEHSSILRDGIKKSYNFIRTNYYFPINPTGIVNPDKFGSNLRLGAHSDIGTMTFLFQDECGGLEVKLSNGEWVDIKPIKNSFILNGGFMLEVWSGGNLPAGPHRVRALSENFTRHRQSVGLFVQPDVTTEMQSLVSNKPNWEPAFSYNEGTTHYEFFKKVILYMSAK